MTTRATAPFSVKAALRFARERLAAPPALPHIRRAAPSGSVLWRFVLPLPWCPPLNRFGEMKTWQRAKLKDQCLQSMLAQHGLRRRPTPLSGRPVIRAIRFSSIEVDEHNGWTKIPIDRLTGKHRGLNYLVDDKPTKLGLFPWWEPAPKGKGFCYFEIMSGDT